MYVTTYQIAYFSRIQNALTYIGPNQYPHEGPTFPIPITAIAQSSSFPVLHLMAPPTPCGYISLDHAV